MRSPRRSWRSALRSSALAAAPWPSARSSAAFCSVAAAFSFSFSPRSSRRAPCFSRRSPCFSMRSPRCSIRSARSARAEAGINSSTATSPLQKIFIRTPPGFPRFNPEGAGRVKPTSAGRAGGFLPQMTPLLRSWEQGEQTRPLVGIAGQRQRSLGREEVEEDVQRALRLQQLRLLVGHGGRRARDLAQVPGEVLHRLYVLGKEPDVGPYLPVRLQRRDDAGESACDMSRLAGGERIAQAELAGDTAAFGIAGDAEDG